MSTLNLFEPGPLSSLEPDKPAEPKSAAVAFLISLVLPGSGQIYAGRRTAGVWTMLFFFLSLLMVTSLLAKPHNPVGDMGLGMALALYPFAFLDAYFSVLEYNAGISTYLIGSNPRIAVILNFLPSGIGYFYLGERAKGLLMFVGLGVFLRQGLMRAFPNSGSPRFGWCCKPPWRWTRIVWDGGNCCGAFRNWRGTAGRLLRKANSALRCLLPWRCCSVLLSWDSPRWA